MKRRMWAKLGLVIAGGALLMAGPAGLVVGNQCSAQVWMGPGSGGGEVVVPGPPPSTPVPEAVPAAPAPGLMWIPGAWNWAFERGGWVWRGGYWAQPPFPGAVWVPPRFVHRHGQFVWIQGAWR